MKVTNTGTETAETVALQLTYPPDILKPDSPDFCLEGTAPCALGSMTAGAVRKFPVRLMMRNEGAGLIKATVSTSSDDSVLANNVDEAAIEVLQPTIRLLPAVARPGTVTMAYGEQMPPGTRVRVKWLPGITVNRGPFKVRADGTMRAPLVLVRHDLLGTRDIIATSVPGEFGPVRGPMLVVPRMATPPSFLSRG